MTTSRAASGALAAGPLISRCLWRRHRRRRRSLARQQGHVDRLPDAQLAGFFRQRLDQKNELGALLEAVDDRRRELGLPGDEADPRREIAGTAVASDLHRVAVGDRRQRRLGYVEAHLDVARRQQRQHRPAGGHHLAGTVVDLLHGAVDGAEDAAARQAGLRGVQPRLRVAQHGERRVVVLLRAGAALQQHRGTIIGLLRVGHGCLYLVEVGALQVVVDREQRVAGLDRVALAHQQGLHPPDFVRRDEDEIGLDPALVAVVGLDA
jgi:hypothetical protein